MQSRAWGVGRGARGVVREAVQSEVWAMGCNCGNGVCPAPPHTSKPPGQARPAHAARVGVPLAARPARFNTAGLGYNIHVI